VIAPISLLVPTYNEAANISACLKAIARQTYPSELVDVVLIDGRSTDDTLLQARQTADREGLSIRILHNEARRTAIGLNIGLKHAQGDLVARVDARSRIPPHYLQLTATLLASNSTLGVVGGAQVTEARSSSIIDRGVARALRNRWTTGLSRYRRRSSSGPADTVWMGVFRAEELRRIGGWNESLAINEDFELNSRYRQQGKIVWFEDSLSTAYVPRSPTGLAHQYYRYGRHKGALWVRGQTLEPRQVVALAAPPLLALPLITLSIRRRNPTMSFGLALVSLLVADHVGTPNERAELSVRLMSATTIALYCTSWWIGTVVGAADECYSSSSPGSAAPRT